jgi:hypothetical protein
MSFALGLGLGLLFGCLLGHLHFTLLRRSVAAWVAGAGRGFWLTRALCILGSAVVLVLVAKLAGFPPFLAAAAGFLLARIVQLRRPA